MEQFFLALFFLSANGEKMHRIWWSYDYQKAEWKISMIYLVFWLDVAQDWMNDAPSETRIHS